MHTSILLQYINRTDGPVKDGMVQAPHQVESQANPAASRPRLLAVRQVIAGVDIGNGRQQRRPRLLLLASLVRVVLAASLVRVDPVPRQAAHQEIAGDLHQAGVPPPRHLLASLERVVLAASLVRVDQDLRQAAPPVIAGDLLQAGAPPPRHLLASPARVVLASLVRADPSPHQAAHLAIGDMVDGVVMDGPDGAVDQAVHQERVVRVDPRVHQVVHQETNGDHHQVGDILLRRHHHQGRAENLTADDRHVKFKIMSPAIRSDPPHIE